MNIALFSTAYFPPVAYMAALNSQTEALIEVRETFPKQTYRNRMVIMTAGGVRALTVPVVRRNHSRTDEVTIDYKERWNTVHFRTLSAAYGASPYWAYYQDDIEQLLCQRYDRLVDLNLAVTNWLAHRLKLRCHLEFTTDYMFVCNDADDYRSVFSPKIPYATEGFPPYCQVFSDRYPFAPNLSVLDLLLNMGPEAGDYLKTIKHG
mgnify:CR=1 FL=1